MGIRCIRYGHTVHGLQSIWHLETHRAEAVQATFAHMAAEARRVEAVRRRCGVAPRNTPSAKATAGDSRESRQNFGKPGAGATEAAGGGMSLVAERKKDQSKALQAAAAATGPPIQIKIKQEPRDEEHAKDGGGTRATQSA